MSIFDVVERPKFSWTIRFRWAADKEYNDYSLTGVFRRLPLKQQTELAQKVREEGHSYEAMAAFLEKVVVRFEDFHSFLRQIGFESPESLEGDDPALREFLFSDSAIVMATFQTYLSVVQGIEEKNSGKPPAASAD